MTPTAKLRRDWRWASQNPDTMAIELLYDNGKDRKSVV